MKKTAAGLILMLSSLHGAHAQGCDWQEAEPAAVAVVSGDGSLRLDDGRHLRLAGVEASPLTLPSLVSALRAHLPSGMIVLVEAGAADRWGESPASVYLPSAEADDAIWLAGLLLRDGASRALPAGVDAPCRDALLTAETAAREAGRGVWAAPATRLIDARDRKTLLAKAGERVVVAGTAVSAGQGRSMIFLNFGPHRYQDFTVMVSRRREKSFVASGKTPQALVGRRLLVRGVVSGRREPRIEAYTPDDIGFLDRGAPEPAGP